MFYLFTLFSQFLKKFVLRTIRLYQKTLSFDTGPFRFFYPNGYCKFHPNCSEYAYQAIDRKGLYWGSWMAFKRILRCHPFSKGGIDEVR